MGKTLYLNESKDQIRVVRDGPSVLIKTKERACSRVPARLLSRVVIIGNVRLDAGSITLFAEHDIPVVFMDRRAEEVAVTIPYNHRLASHYEAQKVFLENKENILRYEKWANTKRMVIQVGVLKRLDRQFEGRLIHGLGEGNYKEIISRLKRGDENKWQMVTGFISNLLRGVIIERLLKADLDPHTGVIHRRHNFGLALDICYVLGAESDMQGLQFLQSKAGWPQKAGRFQDGQLSDLSVRNMVHRFENRLIVLYNMIEIIIDELFELMREIRT